MVSKRCRGCCCRLKRAMHGLAQPAVRMAMRMRCKLQQARLCMLSSFPGQPATCSHHPSARRPRRQRLFTIHAAGILSLHTAYSCCYVSALALQVGQPDCSYAWVALSALEFVRVRQ